MGGARRVGGLTSLLVVEITSQSTAHLDRTSKFERYQDAGIAQYWIVDPGSEDRVPAVEVYDFGDHGQYRLQATATGAEHITVTGPLPAAVTPAELLK